MEGLQWEEVDLEALSPLERARALVLLDRSLSEVGAVSMAEADMMSLFLDEKGLGEKFVSSESFKSAPARSYEDAQKIAVALLRGPMAESRFATMFEGSDEASLKSTLRLHESASQRKWGEFAEPVKHVRAMKAFLKSEGKRDDYLKWADEESGRRQQEHEQAMAAKGAEARVNAEASRSEREAAAKELAEQRQQERESQLAQQALYAQSTSGDVADGDYGDDYYADRYYGYGTIARLRRWHRHGPNQVRARQHTQQRMNNWHGAGRAGGRGGRGGGGRP
jgi:hypothetical protein